MIVKTFIILKVDDFLSSGTSSGSAGSASPDKARRSQRQQDRHERQEADRILAENQQMLQREKELLTGIKPPGSPALATTTPIPQQAHEPVTPSPTTQYTSADESLDR